MSYDLYFYKRKESDLSTKQITDYLSTNVTSTSESNTQWFVENTETETYFSIDLNEPNSDEEIEEPIDNLVDFVNTNFTFNLNYLRPDFFGQEAFEFIDKFISDLDLYVYNPQDMVGPDIPVRPAKNELYKNWSDLNAKHSATHFDEYNLIYFPLDKSNYIYNYRRNKVRLQEQMGEGCYVSKLYTFLTKADNQVISLALLPEESSVVIPKADYYLVTKKFKKLFKTVEETGLMSYEKVIHSFGHLFEPFDFPDCKILNESRVKEAQKKYNETTFDFDLKEFAVRAEVDKLVNFKPTGV